MASSTSREPDSWALLTCMVLQEVVDSPSERHALEHYQADLSQSFPTPMARRRALMAVLSLIDAQEPASVSGEGAMT